MVHHPHNSYDHVLVLKMDLVTHLASLHSLCASHSGINYSHFNDTARDIIPPDTEEELEAQSKHYLPRLHS